MNFTIGNTQIQFIRESKLQVIRLYNQNETFLRNLSGWLLTTYLSENVKVIDTNTIEIRYKLNQQFALKDVAGNVAKRQLSDIVKKPVLLTFLLKKQMKFLHYNQAVNLFKDIVDFLNYLKVINQPQSIAFFTPKDFIYVEGIFIFLNDTKVFDLDITRENIVIDKYFNKTGFDANFTSPEFFMENIIPRMLPLSSSYYSLGSLIIYVLFGSIPRKNQKDIKKRIEGIVATKLYWALVRCMELDWKNRHLYFI